MNNANNTQGQDTKMEPKQPKKMKKEEASLKDAYKFGIFCVRAAVAAATGKVFGDANVDSALGEAIASLYEPQDIADQGLAYDIALRGAAGAWKAVEGGREWE